MQLVLVGASGRAGDSVALAPVPVSIGLYDTVRGNLPLPQGFKPRQTTIRVLDKPGGRLDGPARHQRRLRRRRDAGAPTEVESARGSGYGTDVSRIRPGPRE